MISDWPIEGPGFEDEVIVREPGEPVVTGCVTQWVSERYHGGPFYVVTDDEGGHYEVHPDHVHPLAAR